MNIQNYLIEALAIVDSWELEDSAISFAVAAQASFMSHISADDMGLFCTD